MNAFRALLENAWTKTAFQILLVCISFTPFVSFGAIFIYLAVCVVFSVFFIFFHIRQDSSEISSGFFYKFFAFLFYATLAAGIAFFTTLVYWENSTLTLAVVLVSLPFFILLFFMQTNKERRLYYCAVLLVMEHLILYYFPEPLKQNDYDKILKQKYVAPIFLFYNGNKPSSINGILAIPKDYGDIRTLYVDSAEKNLYCILHGPPAPHVMAMKLPIDSLYVPLTAKNKFRRLRTDKAEPAGARDMVTDDKNSTAYILGINGTVFKINLQRFQVVKKLHTGMNRMMKLYLHHGGKQLLVLSETGEMHDYSISKWKSLKSANTYGNTYAFLPTRKNNIIYIVQWGDNAIMELNLSTFRLSQGLQGNYYPTGADIREEEKIIYLTGYFHGRLMVVDTRDMKITNSIKIKRGLREARWDTRRRLLYMGNFQKGTLYVFDTKRNKILKELFMGKKLRHIYITPKTHQVLVATRYGVFSVDVDGILKTIIPKKTPSH